MNSKHTTVIPAPGALSLGGLAPQPADAAIRCNGPYQVVKGTGEIATPYCEDNYLAYIGRRFYGTKYSARQVRQNPFAKQETCIIAGHDIRVSNICRGFQNSGGRAFD